MPSSDDPGHRAPRGHAWCRRSGRASRRRSPSASAVQAGWTRFIITVATTNAHRMTCSGRPRRRRPVCSPSRKYAAKHTAAPQGHDDAEPVERQAVPDLADHREPADRQHERRPHPRMDVLAADEPHPEHDEHRAEVLQQQRDAERQPVDRDVVRPLDAGERRRCRAPSDRAAARGRAGRAGPTGRRRARSATNARNAAVMRTVVNVSVGVPPSQRDARHPGVEPEQRGRERARGRSPSGRREPSPDDSAQWLSARLHEPPRPAPVGLWTTSPSTSPASPPRATTSSSPATRTRTRPCPA